MSDLTSTYKTLRDYLSAARPDWKRKDLSAAVEKLTKVEIFEVSELVSALRAKGEHNLNNRLRNVGEKCFTSETMSALRRPPSQGLHAPAAAGDADDVASEESFRAPRPSSSSAALGAAKPLRPLSKEDMRFELEADFDIQVANTCQARELRSLLAEARRLEAMSIADLRKECNMRSVNCSPFGEDSELLVKHLLEAGFPAAVAREQPATPSQNARAPTAQSAAPGTIATAPSAEPARKEPESLSISELFPCSEEELRTMCSARGITVQESEHKGMLALLLKQHSRKEQMKFLEERASLVEQRQSVLRGSFGPAIVAG